MSNDQPKIRRIDQIRTNLQAKIAATTAECNELAAKLNIAQQQLNTLNATLADVNEIAKNRNYVD